MFFQLRATQAPRDPGGTNVSGVHLFRFADTRSARLASARDRLAESRLLCECDVIFEVVRTRSVHEGGYGHNRVRSAA